jgi:hypothetical protein
MVVPGLAATVMVGVIAAFTVIVRLLLVADEADAHVAVEIISQVITSALARVAVLHTLPVATFTPFFFHW